VSNNYKPLETAHELLEEPAKLRAALADRGYLFFRGLMDPKAIARFQEDLRGILLRERYIEDAPDLPFRWSGKSSEGIELQPMGRLGQEIAESKALADIIADPALYKTLRGLFGGEVFSWVENNDRVRIMFKRGAKRDSGGGQKASDATPIHQDGYHFAVDFVTVWMPLMDIDFETGGVVLLEGSHKEGVFEHWWRGAEYVGIPKDSAEADAFRARGAVPVAGTAKPSDAPKTWLRTDFVVGDVLIFHPWMQHRGLPNDSAQLRVSADFRYQRAGTPTVWQARHRLFECHDYLNQTRACVDTLGLDSDTAGRIWEKTRQRGPDPELSVAEQIQQLIEEFAEK
jgi:hypothetical protein